MKPPPFYPILDTSTCLARGFDPVEAASEIIDGGAQILQFRHKGFFSREVFGWVQQIAGLAKYSSVEFFVNDRADVAKLFGAGLHLGQDDLPPAAARSIIGEELAVGFSTHNEAQLRAAAQEPADYLAIGPIFGTFSKANPDPVVGLEELGRLRHITDLPLVAIGGITLENSRQVLDAGADSVAVIGDLFASGDLRARVAEWVRATGSL